MSREPCPHYDLFVLPVTIRGVGKVGDLIIYDPDQPYPPYRLTNVKPLNVSLLPKIKREIREFARRKADEWRAGKVEWEGPPSLADHHHFKLHMTEDGEVAR